MNSEGVEVKPLRELTGNAMFNTVFIDDVFVPDDLVLGEVNRGWEVSRNTLTAERVSIGGSEPRFLANLDVFVEFVGDGHFDQIGHHRAGELIAEGHAAKLLNLRSTLLTLAGGDAMPVGGDLQAAVDAHRPGLCRVRGVVVRNRRRDRRYRLSCLASGRSICWPAGRRRSTAAPPRCSSTSSPSGCSDCPATRKPGHPSTPSRRESPRKAEFSGAFASARGRDWREGLAALLDLDLAQFALEDLAGGVARQFVEEDHLTRHLVARKVFAHVGLDRVLVDLGLLLERRTPAAAHPTPGPRRRARWPRRPRGAR